MSPREEQFPESSARVAEAVDWFCRLHSEEADVEDLTRFDRWRESDPENAAAYRRVRATWSAFGSYGSAPEIMAARHQVLEEVARQGPGRRWAWGRGERMRWAWVAGVAAVAIGLAVVASVWWQSSTVLYATGPLERRMLTLADGSVVTLDVNTRMRVSYRRRARLISLEQGQACFDVAKDPSRPFRIQSGDETIVALGTQLNVDVFGHDLLVSMIEGHVAVYDRRHEGRSAARIDLRTGEALRVSQDGQETLFHQINIDHVTAWLNGHLVFDNESLLSAAERVGRYTAQRIEVAPSVAPIQINGIFNVGDANAFVEAVTSYFPVRAVRADTSTVYLVARNTADPSMATP